MIVKGWQGSNEQLLGNMTHLPSTDSKLTAQEDQANLPLAELWLQWDRERPAATRDDDGLELLRALLVLFNSRVSSDDGALTRTVGATSTVLTGTFTLLHQIANAALAGLGIDTQVASATPTVRDTPRAERLRHRQLVTSVLGWVVRLWETAPAGAVDLLLDSVETALALIPRGQLEEWFAAQAAGANISDMPVTDPRNDGSMILLK